MVGWTSQIDKDAAQRKRGQPVTETS